MVSSSRKKSKGKERKAKKVEAEKGKTRELWLGWAKGFSYGIPTISCKHGCDDVLIPNKHLDHPLISSFMDDFTNRWLREVTTVKDMIKSLFQTHQQLLNDDIYKQIAIIILTRMGTNLLLVKPQDTIRASILARSIIALEHYDNGDSLERAIHSRQVQTKLRDLDMSVSSNRRDVLKFYSKRVSCSCLKAMHQEAKRTQPKMGRCECCMSEKKRVDLSVCSLCMVTHYCSRECQVDDWSEHIKDCDLFRGNVTHVFVNGVRHS